MSNVPATTWTPAPMPYPSFWTSNACRCCGFPITNSTGLCATCQFLGMEE